MSLMQALPDLCVPLGQSPLIPGLELTQADDEVEPAAETVPVGQEEQEETEVPPVPDLYVPAGQLVQDVSVLYPALYVPGPQLRHDEPLRYCPGPQLVVVVVPPPPPPPPPSYTAIS